ncbi:hypothetical protein [Brachyspira sp. G79]|uniref:hypothetical protein n=1 Tax=Brachyspira sp. G79 TaxID=1358104 RepID=UPI000BBC84A4|nr:hypothetical protein [Brachyspira sp. G79]PCG20534.1 hypothetical protein KQ44_11405 [Brachyspira sp. G79]
MDIKEKEQEFILEERRINNLYKKSLKKYIDDFYIYVINYLMKEKIEYKEKQQLNYNIKELIFLIGNYQLNIARDYSKYYAYIQYKKNNGIKIAVKIEHYDLDVVLNEVNKFFKKQGD